MHFRPPNGIVGVVIYLVSGFGAYALCMLGLYRSEVQRVWGLVWSEQ